LAVLPDDSIILGGQGAADWTVGETTLKSASDAGPFLMQISDAGAPLWATLFCIMGGYSAGTATVTSLAETDGTLRALVEHEGQLEVGLTQPLGQEYVSSTYELLTLDLDQAPEGEP
jgi:hypothetical protein